MDPKDDFEFKPITEGLGFHKKTLTLKEIESQFESEEPLITTSRPARNPSASVPGSIRFQLEKELEELKKPTQRREEISRPVAPEPEIPPLRRGANPLFSREIHKRDFIEKKEVSVRRRESNILPTSVSPISVIFDGIVVVGLSFLFTALVLWITKADIIHVIQVAAQDQLVLLSLVALVFSVVQIYVNLSRSFFGATLGDWISDRRLGTVQQQNSPFYPLQVLLRSFLVAVTGFIFFPFLSLLFRRDLLAGITGLSIQKES